MKLTFKYFASVRERLGVAQKILEVDVDQITVGSLRDRLAARGPRAADALNSDSPIRVAVNQEMVVSTFVVRQDSVLAFFPPVTGG